VPVDAFDDVSRGAQLPCRPEPGAFSTRVRAAVAIAMAQNEFQEFVVNRAAQAWSAGHARAVQTYIDGEVVRRFGKQSRVQLEGTAPVLHLTKEELLVIVASSR